MAEQLDVQKSNKYLLISGIVAAILIVGLITNGFGLSKLLTGNSANNSIPLEIKDSPVIGDANAPVTIYEFSDFSCSYCATAAENAIPLIVKNYVDTGKARLVFKYYPGHGAGKAALVVGYGMNEQGLFWKYQTKAFANQADVGSLEKMKKLAEESGADMKKLNDFINSGRAEELMRSDIAMAKSNGISATPTFVINGKLLIGAQDFSEFKKVIDRHL